MLRSIPNHLRSLHTFFYFFFQILRDICFSVSNYLKNPVLLEESPQLYFNQTAFNERIVKKLKATRKFAPLWWASGPSVQTFLVEFLYSTLNIQRTSEVFRELIITDDFQTLVLDWINFQREASNARAIVVIFPGLCGTTDACYVKPWHGICQKMGYMTVVINRRGFLKDFPLDRNTERYPSYMDCEDMKLAMDAIHKRFPNIPKFGVGYSAGGNHLIGYVVKGSKNPKVLDGCINVACGNDISKCEWFMGDTPLGRLFSTGPKQIKDFNGHLPFYKAIVRHGNLMEIDRYYAIKLGYKDLDDYYKACCTHELMSKIKIPTLSVMSADDPLLQYGHKEDYISFSKTNDHIISVITERGGHCAWIQNDFSSWVTQLIVEYVEALVNKQA